MKLPRLLLATLWFALPITLTASWKLTSPSGKLSISVRMTEQEALSYQVALDEQVALDWSQLGLTRSGWTQEGPVTSSFATGLSFQTATTSDVANRYTMVTGKRRQNEVSGRQLSLLFHNADGHPLRLDLRAFDHGVAFRYAFPDHNDAYQTIEQEHTSFNLGTDGQLWAQPFDPATFWTPAYENFTLNGIPLGTATNEPDGVGWALPLLAKTPHAWVLVHEAGLDETYHGIQLEPEPVDGIYVAAPPDQRDGLGFGSNQARATLPWTSPWRFMIVSENLGDIVESNLVFDLAEPSRIKDPSWIKPGVSSWSWWSDHDSSQNMAALQSFIDFAAEMNWPYSLVDANWNLISETSMQELVAYADERGVDLLFWYNSGGPHNAVTEQPRNVLWDTDSRRAEFAKLNRLGVKGVKIDFFQSDKQFLIDYYLDILEDAAAARLVVNFHGCTIPRGWERTWPNLVTSEAVFGAEAYSFSSGYAAYAPTHNTILPFSRNVIGSMDYTPVTWTERNNRPRLTSNVHEVALAVVFESGIQHLADAVEPFQSLPEAYQSFFRRLPTVWDETRYLAGFPGRDVVLARRYGKDWFIAGINGEDRTKELTLPLDTLGTVIPNAVMLFDEENGGFGSASVSISEAAPLTITMQPHGGFVIAPLP